MVVRWLGVREGRWVGNEGNIQGGIEQVKEGWEL